jgi:hypothetical protein
VTFLKLFTNNGNLTKNPRWQVTVINISNMYVFLKQRLLYWQYLKYWQYFEMLIHQYLYYYKVCISYIYNIDIPDKLKISFWYPIFSIFLCMNYDMAIYIVIIYLYNKYIYLMVCMYNKLRWKWTILTRM